jgi:hypothetical protein
MTDHARGPGLSEEPLAVANEQVERGHFGVAIVVA